MQQLPSIRVLTAAIALCTLVGSVAAQAQSLSFVEASSEFDNGQPATYAFNAVDGKPGTAWCSQDNPADEKLVFTFSKPTTVDTVGLIVGRINASGLHPDYARAKSVTLFDGTLERSINFNDSPEAQVIKLDAPSTTTRLVLTVKKTHAGKDASAPLCISEVMLGSNGRELTGSTVARNVRGLIPPARKLLHTWVDLLDGTERTLRFSVDGTFTFTYEPLLEGKPVRFKGRWRRTTKSVILTVGKKKHVLKATIGRIDNGYGQTLQLHLTGDAPDPSLVHPLVVVPVRPVELDDDLGLD